MTAPKNDGMEDGISGQAELASDLTETTHDTSLCPGFSHGSFGDYLRQIVGKRKENGKQRNGAAK